MNPERLLKNFRKFGGMVIIFNHVIAFFIIAIAFPVFRDIRLFVLSTVIMLLCFTILFTYYMLDMKKLMKLIVHTDEESILITKRLFRKYPMRVQPEDIGNENVSIHR